MSRERLGLLAKGRSYVGDVEDAEVARCRTRIPKFDEILGPGIPWGSSLLIGGVAGTGKTVLSLEFLYQGALAGEKGILFSFEETAERLLATARGLGCSPTAAPRGSRPRTRSRPSPPCCCN